jgi:chromosome segregation ATPase
MAAPDGTQQKREAVLETELLDRLERQVSELTELRARVKTLQSALEAERKARSEMAARLASERDRVRKLQHELESLSAEEDDVRVLREELARERQSAVSLGAQLEQAWTQLNELKAAQRHGRGPFRRKHR